MFSQHSNTPILQHSAARRGATRPELVFLLACVLLVLSVVIPSWVGVVQRRRLALARADIRLLADAGRRFVREYGVWPTARTSARGDVRFGRELPNREIVHALKAVNADGNEDHAVNPQRINFLNAPSYAAGGSGLTVAGDYLDPWGTPYQVVFDTDFNDICDVQNSIYGRLVGEGMVIWSCGPDRRSDTLDDILSWRVGL
ncbi:MAG: hypothetical protein V1929_07275 [bacterium]